MPGLDAISATGGWKVAAIAPTIVFISLGLLAVIVSALGKLLQYWDLFKETLATFINNMTRSGNDGQTSRASSPSALPTGLGVAPLTEEEKQAAAYLEMIVKHMEEPFRLTQLMALADQRGVPHCLDHIQRLLDTGCIHESDKWEEAGLYYWKGC